MYCKENTETIFEVCKLKILKLVCKCHWPAKTRVKKVWEYLRNYT